MASEYGDATWKISLWLCNDQGAYESMRDAFRWGVDAETAFHDLFVDYLPEGMARDMFVDLLGLVDWDEIESDVKGDDFNEEEDY